MFWTQCEENGQTDGQGDSYIPLKLCLRGETLTLVTALHFDIQISYLYMYIPTDEHMFMGTLLVASLANEVTKAMDIQQHEFFNTAVKV